MKRAKRTRTAGGDPVLVFDISAPAMFLESQRLPG
jgi:hypothetical protein